jgi:signal transduction histidine kinase
MEHVQRAARMSALGHLSAGLAHEIRNPLAGIEGAAVVVERSPENEEQRKEFLGIIQEESRRLNRLVTQFLDFARPRAPELRLADVGELLHSVINLVSQTLPRLDISIETQIASDLEPFMCDPEQLKQVILNLLLNSVQAMPNGGRIVVSAAKEQATLKIRVRDQGTGIPKEMVDSIYDPFFTTKETGTGLGLPIAYQVIEQHGGELILEENSEQGACFAITIPAEGKTNEQ